MTNINWTYVEAGRRRKIWALVIGLLVALAMIAAGITGFMQNSIASAKKDHIITQQSQTIKDQNTQIVLLKAEVVTEQKKLVSATMNGAMGACIVSHTKGDMTVQLAYTVCRLASSQNPIDFLNYWYVDFDKLNQ